MMGENVFANCWYSGCSLIVHGIKYILFLFLCGAGCVCSMSGMGPGLVSMSPLRRSIRCSTSFLLCGMFFLFLCVLYLFVLFFVGICFGCCVTLMYVFCFLFVRLCVVLYWYFLVFL